ncbi:HYR domain-containing protein [Pedococcus bigeumensis]|uniref:HYR domain-containing protein n=1 Tax=Pedococcus bigeumensis TaxID=433644 RepID=UPI0031CE7037
MAVFAAASLTFFSAGSALADQVTPDGDTVAAATTDLVATACTLPVTRSGLVEVKRTGGSNTSHYLPGETLSIAITDGSTQVTTSQVGGPVVVPDGFTANGARQSFTFPISTTISSGAATGNTTVAVKVTSAAYPDGDTGTFAVSWNCTSNTAPLMTLSGVTAGGSYEFGSAPTATCSWTDDHDGSGNVTPTVSALSGPRAASGLGSRTVSCSYTDAGGLLGTATATYSIVDTTGPSLSTVSNLAVDAVNAAGAPATYTAPTATDAVDGSRPVTCLPDSGSTFPIGSTPVTCSASDLSGHSSSTTFSVSVADHTGPVVTVPADVTISATSPAGATRSFNASASDNVDGAVLATCTPASGSTFPFGPTTVTCTAKDAAGNTGSGSFVVTVQDKTAPLVTVHEPAAVEATGPSGAAVGWTAATALDDVDGARPVSCNHASGATYPVGNTTVTCTADDTHGNTGSATFTVTVTDETPPALTVPDDIVEEATSPAGAVVSWSTSATDLVDGAVVVHCTPTSGTQFSLDTPTTVSCSATDAHGNDATRSFKVNVVDTTAPTLPVFKSVTEEATGPDGADVTYLVGSATDAVDGNVGLVCTPASGSTFALGKTTVTCTATDSHDNAGTGHFTVTVEDTTPPVFNDISVETVEATGPSGAPVSFSATATDLVDPSPAVLCDPASGSVFALGATQVKCTATDDAGNSVDKTFTVNVADTTAPVVGAVASQTIEATSAAGAAHSWVVPTATDIVDGARPVTCDRAQGSTFPLGNTVVNCSATDLSGNVGKTAFTVTVVDTTAPSFGAVANRTATATSANGAVVTYPTPEATDLVDGATAVTCTPPSGSTFPLGTTNVKCTSTDRTGNTATVSFSVTVTVGWSGVLAPVTEGGVYKQGSTIPVKFALTGASAGVTNLQATLWVRKVSPTPAGQVAVAVSTSAATTGNLFRYTDGQYLFNLNTKPLQVGTYELRIDLGDGVPHTVTISLR